MYDSGRVAYVFAAPSDTKSVSVVSHGKADVGQASSVLPAIKAEELTIRKMVRVRD